MISHIKNCTALSSPKHFTSQRSGTQRSDGAKLPPLFEAKWEPFTYVERKHLRRPQMHNRELQEVLDTENCHHQR